MEFDEGDVKVAKIGFIGDNIHLFFRQHERKSC